MDVVISPCCGLSPRVRGNRALDARHTGPHGSIPACTGEPVSPRTLVAMSEVYPRVYGGTPSNTRAVAPSGGLSPRVRGNLARAYQLALVKRSIPACTGEPRVDARAGRHAEVYPRVYGGTKTACSRINSVAGLSPRVRGNHLGAQDTVDMSRSIPACTGEPISAALSITLFRVYPRVYGGTGGVGMSRLRFAGLSPRVRGNLDADLGQRPRVGSIPACTGEPPRRVSRAR